MYKVHVSIGEYEFVEVEQETATEARLAYDGIKAAFQKIEGCDQKTWNKTSNDIKTKRS